MTPFTFERALDAADAATRFSAAPGAHYIAGGTAVVDLMQLGVQAPARLVEILDLRDNWASVELGADGATIGALATMADVAACPAIRAHWAAVAQALDQAASPQIRNTATIGGNLMQRTRCSGFRDTASACNKRQLGTGCAAREGGQTRDLAVLGTSPLCIANYPGDLAVALLALDARLTLLDPDGHTWRSLAVEDLYRTPGDRPDLDTTLAAGALILAVQLPERGWDSSVYVKLRDRDAYAFAQASASVAMRLEDGRVADLRIALGGLASRPWRCPAAEAALRGSVLDFAGAERAADLCLAGAEADAQRAFKLELGRRAVTHALLAAAGSSPAGGNDLQG